MVGIELLHVTSSPQVQKYEGNKSTLPLDNSFHGDPLVGVESYKTCYVSRINAYLWDFRSVLHILPLQWHTVQAVHKAQYPIAGNFRGRKLSQIGGKDFCEENFADCSLVLPRCHTPQFHRENFCE